MIVEIWAEAARNPRIAAITRAIDDDVLRGHGADHRRGQGGGRGVARARTRDSPRAFIFTLVAGLFKRMALEPDFDAEAETPMAIGVLKALFAGALSPDSRRCRRGDLNMRRVLVVLALRRRRRVGGSGRQEPSRPARRRSWRSGEIGLASPTPARRRPSPRSMQPREIEPPAVTVSPAVKREFVDRLFVSGTLVAREEAQVAARIDGLTIVEVDAEDGDRVKAGQVLARLDRSQLDAMLAQNDAATDARRRRDRSGAQLDRAVRGAGAIRQRRLRPRAQACGRRHVRFRRSNSARPR